MDFNYEVESDIATGGECKESNKWVQSNMPDARWSIEDARHEMPDASIEDTRYQNARCQIPDGV